MVKESQVKNPSPPPKPTRLMEVQGKTLHLYLHPGQLRAWESTARIVAMLAGTQCVAGDTVIDNPFGESKTIAELANTSKPVYVWSQHGREVIPALASAPFLKGHDILYRLTTESGREITVTRRHLLLEHTDRSYPWVSVGELLRRLTSGENVYLAYYDDPWQYSLGLSSSSEELCPSTHSSGGLRSRYKGRGLLGHCSVGLYPCDEQLHGAKGTGLKSFPSPGDVRRHTSLNVHEDDRGNKSSHSHSCQYCARLPMQCSVPLSSYVGHVVSPNLPSSGELFQHPGQVRGLCGELNTFEGRVPLSAQFRPLRNLFASSYNLLTVPLLYDKGDKVVKIECLSYGDYYDLQVPVYHNYLAQGLVHHNSGKTSFGPHWLLREIRERGPGDYLAVTSTYDLFKLKMLPELRNVFEHTLGTGRYWAGSRVIELAEDLVPGRFLARNQDDPMWGRIILRSADATAGLEASTAQAAWLDEAGQPTFGRDAWDATLRRLSLSQGRILITTTLYAITWLKSEVFDPWQGGDTSIDVIQFDSLQNPVFPREEYDRAQSAMPRWKFDLFYRGRFARPAGLIYDSFDEATAVISRFELPASWPRYVGMDFGGANTAAIWFAQDPDSGYLWAYREYLAGGESAWGHAEKFKALSAGEMIIKRVGGAPTEDGWREAFTAAGWPVSKPTVKDVEVGISKVYQWHKQGRLFVFSDLVRYLDEIRSYSRRLDDNLQPTEQIDNKSAYHLNDATRYILSDFVPELVPVGSRDKQRPRTVMVHTKEMY